MADFPLPTGQTIIVDDCDVELVKSFKWHIHQRGYPYVYKRQGDGYKQVFLHQMLLPDVQGMVRDHINGNTLDNRRSNLRYCTPQQNSFNKRTQSKSGKSSQYKGVNWHTQINKWQARIRLNGKHKSLGCYEIETEAAKAYDAAARRLFGEFARTNF